jgi:hypothetical protein
MPDKSISCHERNKLCVSSLYISAHFYYLPLESTFRGNNKQYCLWNSLLGFSLNSGYCFTISCAVEFYGEFPLDKPDKQHSNDTYVVLDPMVGG